MRKEASILAMIYLKYKSEKLIILINIPFNQINKKYLPFSANFVFVLFRLVNVFLNSHYR